MYSCSEIVKWIASDEPQNEDFIRRLHIRMHVLLCRHCSRYARQLRALGKFVYGRAHDRPIAEIEGIKERIMSELSRKP